MKRSTRTRGWIAFASSGLILLVILISLLGFSRHQLRKQVMESQFHSLQIDFDRILRDEMLDFVVDDLNFSQASISSDSLFLSPREKIEQAALQSLNIPQVFGVQAYNPNGTSTDLPTSLDSAPLNADMIAEIFDQGWSHRFLDEQTWGLSLRPEELENEYLIEFQLLRLPLNASWEKIDKTLLGQGVLLAVAALILLAIVYQRMISQILAKENLLEEKSRVLAETNRELSQAYKSAGLGAMTGHLLHGLKSPLTSLQALSTNLRKHQEGQQTPELIHTVETLQTLVNRALESIRELEHGEMKYSISLNEFCQIIEERFSKDYTGASLLIQGVRDEGISLDNLQSHLSLAILSNLFKNSIDAKKDARIELNLIITDNALLIRISDNAGGIPAEVAKRLFAPIVSTKQGGTGIGLALSKQLAESIGGTLQVFNNDQTGACFSLSLPIYDFTEG